MIDTFKEDVISDADAAKHVGKLSGKKANPRLIQRWMNKGVSGVKLKSIRIGNGLYTSKEAVNQFLTESRNARRDRLSQATSDGMRRAKMSDIEAEAEALGI